MALLIEFQEALRLWLTRLRAIQSARTTASSQFLLTLPCLEDVDIACSYWPTILDRRCLSNLLYAMKQILTVVIRKASRISVAGWI